jgi:hypothetical protein
MRERDMRGSESRGAANGAVVEALAASLGVNENSGDGIAATNAASWHSAGYDGAGVKVAVIDAGFSGYAGLLGTALPASVTAIDHCGGRLATSPAAGGSERGTAVAEIVHQMAPGAELYLICADSVPGLAQAGRDALAVGARIVVHSVGWFNTSRGDGSGGPGSPDAVVAEARAHGILWVNAAGDEGQSHWSGAFRSDPGNPDLHLFQNTDALNRITLASQQEACVGLKWDSWPVTSEDFDLFLVRASTGETVASSLDDQAGGLHLPTEELCYTNPGPSAEFGLVIVRFSATGSPRLDLIVDQGGPALQYRTVAGAVAEPASSPNAIAVGALCWSAGAPESTNSLGPTIDGRDKPELLGPDRVSTVTYGPSDSMSSHCGDAGFRGSAAGAAHVAGAAALLLEKDPGLAPAGITALLEDAARQTGSSLPGEEGVGALNLPPVSPILQLTSRCCTVVNQDGSGRRLLPYPLSITSRSVWSPDGRKLLLTDGPRLYVGNSDGTALVQVAGVGGVFPVDWEAAWSPDGKKIAFLQAGHLAVMNADGSGVTPLSSGFGLEGEPSWSPDGSKLVWYRSAPVAGIWVVNANGDGSDTTLLLPDAVEAAWAPDGSKIAVTYADRDLYVVNPDGSSPQKLADHAAGPSWSPDSSTISFLRLASGIDEHLEFITSTGAPLPPPAIPITGSVGWQPTAALATAPEATTPPSLSGTAQAGRTLIAGRGSWTGALPMRFTYRWQRCNNAGSGCADVAGATDSAYPLGPADVGGRLRVVVTSTNSNGDDAIGSAASAVVLPAAPTVSAMPAIAGTVQPGQTVSAGSNGAWTGSPTFTYQWRRCADYGGACEDIAGATGAAYDVVPTDVGSTLRLAVLATNAGGSTPAASRARAVASPGATVPGAPTDVAAVPGDAQATVNFTPPASDGGGAIDTYTVTATPGGATATDTIPVVTVTGLTNGTSYTFTVTAANGVGVGPASAPSSAVTPRGAPGAPSLVTASAGDGHAIVAFTPPASDGGAPIAYYTASAFPDGPSASGTGSPIAVGGLTNGASYTFRVTATNNVGTSPFSGLSSPVVPAGRARPHPDPPSEAPRPDVPAFVAPGHRPPRPNG